MPQIGPLEILIVAVLALIVFGPDKLPDMARSVGKGVVQLKRMAADVKSEFDLSLHDHDEDQAAAAAARSADEPAVSGADPARSASHPASTQ